MFIIGVLVRLKTIVNLTECFEPGSPIYALGNEDLVREKFWHSPGDLGLNLGQGDNFSLKLTAQDLPDSKCESLIFIDHNSLLHEDYMKNELNITSLARTKPHVNPIIHAQVHLLT
jgi:hypothetical protein